MQSLIDKQEEKIIEGELYIKDLEERQILLAKSVMLHFYYISSVSCNSPDIFPF